jgi:hypothetical protein
VIDGILNKAVVSYRKEWCPAICHSGELLSYVEYIPAEPTPVCAGMACMADVAEL